MLGLGLSSLFGDAESEGSSCSLASQSGHSDEFQVNKYNCYYNGAGEIIFCFVFGDRAILSPVAAALSLHPEAVP